MYFNRGAFNARGAFTPVKPRLSRLAKLFITILLVVIFEGALRKWVSSGLTNPLVLLRDSLALYGIYFALKNGFIRTTQFASKILIVWTYVFLIWGLMQLLINQSSPFIFIIGVRFWLLYLWFAYAAAVSFTAYDFNYIGKTIILILLIMTPLAVVQSFLPPGAFLNQQVDGDESTVFRVTADIVRTTGTFSFTYGYAIFLALATPFVLSLLLPGTKLWNHKWTPMATLLALAIATIVSGSRGSIIFFALMFSIYIIISLLYAKRSKKGATLVMVVFIFGLVALVPNIFNRSTLATQERFASAAASENIYDRVQTMILGEPDIYNELPLIGHGIGFGTNFAGVVATGQRTFLLAETETARTILEGGLLGFIFICLKIFVIVVGTFKSWVIARATRNILPLLLWFTTSVALLSWSIIGQLTANALGYLLLGLAVTSLRLFRIR